MCCFENLKRLSQHIHADPCSGQQVHIPESSESDNTARNEHSDVGDHVRASADVARPKMHLAFSVLRKPGKHEDVDRERHHRVSHHDGTHWVAPKQRAADYVKNDRRTESDEHKASPPRSVSLELVRP